jgi:hypothetical protein
VEQRDIASTVIWAFFWELENTMGPLGYLPRSPEKRKRDGTEEKVAGPPAKRYIQSSTLNGLTPSKPLL